MESKHELIVLLVFFWLDMFVCTFFLFTVSKRERERDEIM